MPDDLLFLPFLLRWNERNERSFWHLAQGTLFGGCLGRDVKKCQVYFIHINFFKKPKKKYNRAKELFCDATIFVFWFFIVYLQKNGYWKMAQGRRLSPTGNFRIEFRIISALPLCSLYHGALPHIHSSADSWDCLVEYPKNRTRLFRSQMVNKQGRI